MAIAFTKTKGKAAKKSVESFEYKDGDNTVRLVGGVLPRYVYWVKGTNNKDIPLECLAFDRELEKFANRETDHVPAFYPEKKCSWSYSINCIDPRDGKVKALNLKKKLFEQVMTAAEDLGDPTDPDTGWDIVFKKVKTGPLPYNVEYQLSVLKCKRRALTEAEREAVAKADTIDVKFPRPSSDEILETIKKIQTPESGSDDAESQVPEEARDL